MNGAGDALPQTNWFKPSGDVLQGGNRHGDLLDVHCPIFFELQVEVQLSSCNSFPVDIFSSVT